MNNENLASLESVLKENIIGQNRAMETVAQAFGIGEYARDGGSSPKTVTLFLGPSGVGKTESAKVIARHLYGSEEALIRFDMSEFVDLSSVNEFRGSPSNPEGRLGNALKEKEEGILFFDEVEKAHPDILLLFLQLFGDARITTSAGTTYSVRNFHIICTSNVGADKILYASNNVKFETLQESLKTELNEVWRAEFVGRFKNLVIFDRLRPDTQRKIAKQKLLQYLDSLKFQGHHLTYLDDLLEYVARKGCNNFYGARPLINAISQTVGGAVLRNSLTGKSTSGLLTIDQKTGTADILSEKECIAKRIVTHFQSRHKGQYHLDLSLKNYILNLEIDDVEELIKSASSDISTHLDPFKTGKFYYCQDSGKFIIDETYEVQKGKNDLIDYSPWALNIN